MAIFSGEDGYVEIKTGNLRNNLSRCLKRVRRTGETIVVLDRDTPVAEIRPYVDRELERSTGVWARREAFEAAEGALDEDFELPVRRTADRKHGNPQD